MLFNYSTLQELVPLYAFCYVCLYGAVQVIYTLIVQGYSLTLGSHAIAQNQWINAE